MNNIQKIILGVVAIIAIAGNFFPLGNGLGGAFATSTSGASFSSAKWYATTLNPSVTSATTSSLYNSDGTDRIIQDVTATCSNWGSSRSWPDTGTGLLSAGFSITAATSSVSGAAGNANTNYVLQSSFATTSNESYLASTTPGQTATVDFRRWPAGSYLNFLTNATNTAQCIIGVHTISS